MLLEDPASAGIAVIGLFHYYKVLNAYFIVAFACPSIALLSSRLTASA